jgi:hypothetical protein
MEIPLTIQQGAQLQATAVHLAVLGGSPETLKLLLEDGMRLADRFSGDFGIIASRYVFFFCSVGMFEIIDKSCIHIIYYYIIL